MGGTKFARALVYTLPLVVVALLLAAACASGDGGTERTPTAPPDASASPDSAATTAALPSPGPDEYPPLNPSITPRVPLSEALSHADTAWQGPLTPFTAEDASYTISVPKNWRAEQKEGQDFLALVYRDETGLFADLHMQCVDGVTPDELIVLDRDQIFALEIGYRVQLPRTTTIGDHTYQEVRWTGGLAGLITDYVSFYFVQGTCTWRLQFGSFQGIRIEDHRQDIDAILASFKIA